MSRHPALDADLAGLHFRLLTGDREAEAELIARLLRLPMPALSKGQPPGFDPAHAEQALLDAVVAYWRRPGRYDPARASLATYIAMIAARKLKNLARGDWRRLARLTRLTRALEVAPSVMDASPSVMDSTASRQRLPDVRLLARTAEERAFLEAKLGGERQTTALAARLGLRDRPPAEQRRAVKRIMDRLRARGRRFVKNKAGSHRRRP
jgi:RNA polymerase sigma-70 factor (ECF subfamily)